MTSPPDPPIDSAAENPRAFSQASGLVFQTIGLVLLLVGCCVFSLSGKLQDELGRPIGSFGEWIEVASVPQIVAGMDMMLTFVAGIALVTVGIGLQGDKVSAGTHAVIVTSIFAVGWWGSLLAQILYGGGGWSIVISLLMAGVGTLLFLFAGNSARTLRLNPPSADETEEIDEIAEIADLEPPSAERQIDQVLDDLG